MDEQEFTASEWKRYWRMAKMKPTYHLRGTPWPLSVTGPKFAVVAVRETPFKSGKDVAWFFRESEAREYIKLMEQKRRKK